MDCNTARFLSELRGNRPNELPADDAASLAQHLRACPECQRLVAIEQRLDAHVGKAMRSVPVPPHLKTRILDQLATQRGASHRRRFFFAVAAAACVVIAVGILTWKPDSRVRFDINEVSRQADQNFENPQGEVDRFLATQGIKYQPEIPLNPRLLAFHGTTTLQGKQVPMLYYRSFERNLYAQVFIIREADFDLSALPQNEGGSGLGHQIKIVRDADPKAKHIYVILFNGDSLDPFKPQFAPV